MAHYDDDTLALLALGERAADDNRHLGGCGSCQAEVERFSQVVRVGRGASADDQPERPPARVWERITGEIAMDSAGGEATAELAAPVPPPPTVVPLTRAASVPSATTAPRADPQRARRMNPALLAVAAAVVGVLVGTLATLGITARTDDVPSSQNIAQTVLAPLDTPTAHGTAVISVSQNQRTLTVRVLGLPVAADGFYEVWLMNAAPQRLVSLGVLDASHSGVFQIPAGLDLASYPVVDISLQPFNGSPEHSGTSSVRGTLKA